MPTLRLSDIKVDLSINPRAKGLDEPTVSDYAERLSAGSEFPPVVVYHDGTTYWLSEGFHRHAACGRAGLDSLPAEARRGGRKEALINALASNQKHGLKRTNDDKRLAVRLALETVPDWTDEKIAGHCGVGADLVSTVKVELVVIRAAEEIDAQTDDIQTDEFPLNGNSVVKKTAARTTAGRPKTKEDHAKKATRLILKDHTRTDADIAKELGCKESTVKTARKALADKGRIPAPGKKPPSSGGAEVSGEGSAAVEPAGPEPVVVPPTPVDDWGIPVQPHAAEAFAALPQFRELVGLLQQCQRLFNVLANTRGGVFLTLPEVSSYRRGKKQDDGGYADRFVHEGLETCLRQVKNAAPTHTVCPWNYVEAPHPRDCKTCLNQNWTPALGNSVPDSAVARAKGVFGV